MKVEDVQHLERTERMMVRWMCGVTLRDRKSSEELRKRLGNGDSECVQHGESREIKMVWSCREKKCG